MPDKTLHPMARELKGAEKKKWITDFETCRLFILENDGITSEAGN